jgi:hypothetical protein
MIDDCCQNDGLVLFPDCVTVDDHGVSHPLQIFLSFGRKKVMDLKNIQRKAILMHSRACSRKSLGGGNTLYSRQKSGFEGGYIDGEDKSGLVEERWMGETVTAGIRLWLHFNTF